MAAGSLDRVDSGDRGEAVGFAVLHPPCHPAMLRLELTNLFWAVAPSGARKP